MHKKKAKILIIGDAAAGKSTLVQSYAKKNYQFSSDYTITTGAQVYSKIVPFTDVGKDVQLFLYDLSGHQFYQSLALSASKNPDLVLVAYDCTNQDTLKNGLKWLDKIKKLNNKSTLPGVLVATKSQYKTAKEISAQEGETYAKKFGFDFFQVSAAYNTNVDKPFSCLAKKVLDMPTTSYS